MSQSPNPQTRLETSTQSTVSPQELIGDFTWENYIFREECGPSFDRNLGCDEDRLHLPSNHCLIYGQLQDRSEVPKRRSDGPAEILIDWSRSKSID
jgi:hypothetical protein